MITDPTPNTEPIPGLSGEPASEPARGRAPSERFTAEERKLGEAILFGVHAAVESAMLRVVFRAGLAAPEGAADCQRRGLELVKALDDMAPHLGQSLCRALSGGLKAASVSDPGIAGLTLQKNNSPVEAAPKGRS